MMYRFLDQEIQSLEVTICGVSLHIFAKEHLIGNEAENDFTTSKEHQMFWSAHLLPWKIIAAYMIVF